jgi:hypothetical protein
MTLQPVERVQVINVDQKQGRSGPPRVAKHQPETIHQWLAAIETDSNARPPGGKSDEPDGIWNHRSKSALPSQLPVVCRSGAAATFFRHGGEQKE